MPIAPQVSEPDFLQRVTLRLVGDDERDAFDRTLEEQHYRASARLAGQTLRYVGVLDGQWVALLTFSAAALHLKGREQWIGWSPRQRARRLGLVVNNSRFLVLPERQRYPNLASRVLGLALRRLSDDWLACWHHPVLVVESFVDETRYRGTCYRACGFEAVGLTAGFGRASRDFYHRNWRDYLFGLKGNPSGVLARAERLLAPRAFPSDENVSWEKATTGSTAIGSNARRSARKRSAGEFCDTILWGSLPPSRASGLNNLGERIEVRGFVSF